MKKSGLIIALILGIILLAGCKTKSGSETESVEIQNPDQICIDACNDAVKAGTDISSGPCLLDPIPQTEAKADFWVCDVAHSPRQEVDNQEENQCQSYIAGMARHFIEVNLECKIIRKR